MALSSSSSSTSIFALALFTTLLLIGSSSAQLSENFYDSKCPKVFYAVKSVLQSALAKEPRQGASIVRLFFHDCFVNVNYYSSSMLSFYFSLVIYTIILYILWFIKGNTFILSPIKGNNT